MNRQGTILWVMLLILSGSSVATAEGPRTIEDAVMASGGTYGVIDTSSPNVVNNFVGRVSDKGLTAQDDRGGNLQLRPGVQVAGMIRDGRIETYSYHGQQGEKLRVFLTSDDLDLVIRLFDANGQYLDVADKKPIGSKELSLEQVLPYTGSYQVDVLCYEARKTGRYMIGIISDVSAVMADERADDGLVAGGTYVVRQLKGNQLQEERDFILEAYCVYKKEHECKCNSNPNMPCKPCGPKYNIGFSDRSDILESYEDLQAEDALLLQLGLDEDIFGRLSPGQKYRSKVRVMNQSRTNVPDNVFRFLAFEE